MIAVSEYIFKVVTKCMYILYLEEIATSQRYCTLMVNIMYNCLSVEHTMVNSV